VVRGEVWWAEIDEKCPVVLLSGAERPELRAMRIVPAATAEEQRGFLVLTAEESVDPRRVRQALDATDVRAAGVEMGFGPDEGLPYDGVVRVALPRDGQIFCTWLVTLTPESLTERAGTLSPAGIDLLGHVLRLAGVE
jgi:mRNA interferase MazF